MTERARHDCCRHAGECRLDLRRAPRRCGKVISSKSLQKALTFATVAIVSPPVFRGVWDGRVAKLADFCNAPRWSGVAGSRRKSLSVRDSRTTLLHSGTITGVLELITISCGTRAHLSYNYKGTLDKCTAVHVQSKVFCWTFLSRLMQSRLRPRPCGTREVCEPTSSIRWLQLILRFLA